MTCDPLCSPTEPEEIEIKFEQGYPSSVKQLKNNETFLTPLKIMQYLNKVGNLHGIGRIDIVENRFIGLKVSKIKIIKYFRILKNYYIFQSRGIYESPGATILYKAHQDLEIFILDREVLRIKSYLTNKMSDYVYNGKKILRIVNKIKNNNFVK